MKAKICKSIQWLEGYHWSSQVPLGTCGIEYNFSALWNTRGDSFEITVKTLCGETIIHHRKMTLGVDLLEHCFSPLKPDCALIPLHVKTENERITYEAMINSEIKLYHLTKIVPV